ncbi:MAG: hypothetical protein O2910_02860 [Proteobacteria bacterium]|nr:hypothetical protein [Pseudomonadota bacterium]
MLLVLLPIWVVLRLYKGLLADVALALVRPVFAALVMAGVLLASYRILERSPFLSIAIRVLVGAFVFAIVAFAIWAASGRPDGAESEVYDRLMQGWRLLKARLAERGMES